MKILFDHNMPWGLRKPLSSHEVNRSSDLGWAELKNGDLLQAAEGEGFDLFLTGDRNIRYQQNLSKRRIATIELTTIQWPSVCLCFDDILEAVNTKTVGSYRVVETRPVGNARTKSRKKMS